MYTTSGKFSYLDYYTQLRHTEVGKINFRKQASEHDLTQEELDALKSFCDHSDINKPADK